MYVSMDIPCRRKALNARSLMGWLRIKSANGDGVLVVSKYWVGFHCMVLRMLCLN